ncbi:S8 family peptidase [Nocardioides sp. URHA0020]|uniref:S8 family peptidase n=1 Tax=Nocardioides sp. URHA0020 TaxID=1380392 RepID=UPI0006885406|nr:S8 family serine peptidase [Nocardioides sp. URHA0020]
MTARPAYLRVTLAAGEARTHAPCHLDCLLGAARPATHLDGRGPLDAALGGAGRFQARSVFHARRSLGRTGQQVAGFADDEEQLGLSRTYLVELGDAGDVARALDRLRCLGVVESAGAELLARTYRAPVAARPTPPTRREAEVPFAMVGAAAAHRIEPGSDRVRVGVVDTGVALDHPELAGRLGAGYDFVDLGMGRIGDGPELLGDASGRDDVPEDEVGHGTHVAGVIGAAGHRVPQGLGGLCVAVPLRVLAGARSGPQGKPFGIGSLSDIDAGMKVAVDRGTRVVNLSLGTSATELDASAPPPHQEVAAYAESRDVVLVAASGNDGTTVPFYPAALPTVLAVGSVDPHGEVSQFTSTGPHVVLHAPGEDIVGLSLHGYRRSTGTSHAAPFASGTAALVAARGDRQGRTLSAADIRRVLIGSARARAPGGPPVLDAEAALSLADRLPTPATHDRRSQPWQH